MKHFNRHHLAILPLLSILAMSPAVMESSFSHRGIASIEVEQEQAKKEEPVRYNALIAKIKPEALLKSPNPELAKLKEKGEKLHLELSTLREGFKKEQSEKDLVAEQRTKIEELVIKSHLLKLDLDQLEVSEEAQQEKICLEESIVTIEGLLTDLEANEVLVANSDTPAIEVEPKQEEKPVVAEEKPTTTEEPKKDEKTDALCELEEQNKVLTAKVEKLVEDQNQIMQAVLGMTQVMMMMLQNQQQFQMPNPYYANAYSGLQNPYQYQQPTTAGNWVYYPSGFQPGQPNIFQQQQQPQPQGLGGFYPDQSHQSSWNLQPQMNFTADPRYGVQQFPVGNFGSTPFSFDLTNNVPTISQL